jgi:hypothetical protein
MKMSALAYASRSSCPRSMPCSGIAAGSVCACGAADCQQMCKGTLHSWGLTDMPSSQRYRLVLQSVQIAAKAMEGIRRQVRGNICVDSHHASGPSGPNALQPYPLNPPHHERDGQPTQVLLQHRPLGAVADKRQGGAGRLRQHPPQHRQVLLCR